MLVWFGRQEGYKYVLLTSSTATLVPQTVVLRALECRARRLPLWSYILQRRRSAPESCRRQQTAKLRVAVFRFVEYTPSHTRSMNKNKQAKKYINISS